MRPSLRRVPKAQTLTRCSASLQRVTRRLLAQSSRRRATRRANVSRLRPRSYGPSKAAAAVPPSPPPSKPYQVDFFGTKRGRGLRDLTCARYEGKVVAMNHCAGPGGGTAMLNCVRCGFATEAHEDLGRWMEGEPMVVSCSGQRFKVLNERTVSSS